MEEKPEHEDWSSWFDRNGPRLLLWARQWTRSASDAEDIVQEAFVRYWKHQRGLGGNPIGLLFASVRRAATDQARRNLRRSTREQASDYAVSDDAPWFDVSETDPERQALLEASIKRLPADQREVLVLKIWGELTFDEISRELDIPANTAASRYRYALAALRKELIPVTP
jgi:RNA polymerase sigma-70 factor, ECF subfamily